MYRRKKMSSQDAELMEMFRLLDKDGSGYVPVNSLRQFLIGMDVEQEVADEMIREVFKFFILIWRS